MESNISELYQGMSKYELMQLSIDLGASILGIFEHYIYLLFAFLAMAYFIGAKLSHFQFLSIAVVYSVYLGLLFFTLYDAMTSQIQLLSFIGDSYSRWGMPTALALLVSGWILSILFIVHSRRRT